MKKYRIIVRYHSIDFYHEDELKDFIIQKKGWFGWKTLISQCGMYGLYYFRWSYFSEPSRSNSYDTFHDHKSCILFLKTEYGVSTIKRKIGDEILV